MALAQPLPNTSGATEDESRWTHGLMVVTVFKWGAYRHRGDNNIFSLASCSDGLGTIFIEHVRRNWGWKRMDEGSHCLHWGQCRHRKCDLIG